LATIGSFNDSDPLIRYPYAMASAVRVTLERKLVIRVASGAAFLAMKWVAFGSRGAADPMSSHDLEDVITVVAGRAKIVDDVRVAPAKVRTFVRTETTSPSSCEIPHPHHLCCAADQGVGSRGPSR